MIELKQATEVEDSQWLSQAEGGWDQLVAREDIGFFRVTQRPSLWSDSETRGRTIQKNYETLVVVGVGGSALGGQAICDSLKPEARGRSIEFFDNIDAQSFWRRMDSYSKPEKVHWLIISKSGSTMETLALANFIGQKLEVKGVKLGHHSTVVSELKSNPLSNWARQNEVPLLEVPEDVGGRFSVLTPVGLVLASYLGVDLEELKSGADWALQQKQLVTTLAAQSLASFSQQKWITLFWVYCDGLKTFGAWFQQLWAESLAKKMDRAGGKGPRVSSPFVSVGINDQHSILQQVMEGARDKFLWFFRVTESESTGPDLRTGLFEEKVSLQGRGLGSLLAAEAEATRKSLADAGVPSLTIAMDKLSAHNMGALLMLAELVVATMGEALNIDTFDQPGVEAGKVLAREIMAKGLNA